MIGFLRFNDDDDDDAHGLARRAREENVAAQLVHGERDFFENCSYKRVVKAFFMNGGM